MQARVHVVVNGVIPITHKPPVHQWRRKVRSKIVFGVHVTSIMLQHVHGDDGVLAPKLGYPDRLHEAVRLRVHAIRQKGVRYSKFQQDLFKYTGRPLAR